jgi:hypothetical protein
MAWRTLRNAESALVRGGCAEAVGLYRGAAALFERDGLLRQASAALACPWRLLQRGLPVDAEAFVILGLELARLQNQLGFVADAQAILRRTREQVVEARAESAAVEVATWVEAAAKDDAASVTLVADALRIAGLGREAAQCYLRAIGMTAEHDGKLLAHGCWGLLAVGADPSERAVAEAILRERTPAGSARDRLLSKITGTGAAADPAVEPAPIEIAV